MTDRITARVVGWLFLTATAAGLAGLAVQQPLLDAENPLSRLALEEGRVATGAFLELVMGCAVVAIAIVIYPVLRRAGERVALGYVVARVIEAVIYVSGTVALLTLLTLGRRVVESGASSAVSLQGDVLLAQRDWGGHAILDATAFGLSAVLLNYGLLRASLVPRWLSLWGLIGAAFYMIAGVLVLYGLEPLSSPQVLLEAPLGLQELVLAIWLITQGFETHEAISIMGVDEPAGSGSRAVRT